MGLLTSIRSFVAEEIEALADFADIPVLVEDRGAVANEIARSLKQLGLFLVVLTPRAPDSKTDTHTPYLQVDLTIHVGEITTTNKTGMRASDAAERIVAGLYHKNMPGTFEPILLRAPPISLIPTPPQLRALTSLYQVNLKTAGGLRVGDDPAQVATPAITASNPAAITISCSTPASAIFYTVNAGRPNPAVGTLYTGPFAAASGAKIQARAGRWGMLGSALATATVA